MRPSILLFLLGVAVDATGSTPTPYELWVQSAGVAPAEAPIAADLNGDGIANGVAWLLGASSPLEEATSREPSVRMSGSALIYEFPLRRSAANDIHTDYRIQLSSDLITWTDITDSKADVKAALDPAHHGEGVDRITVTIRGTADQDLAQGCFIRLQFIPFPDPPSHP